MGWLEGAMPAAAQLLFQDGQQQTEDYLGRFYTSERIFKQKGLSEQEYKTWRKEILPQLLQIWLIGAASNTDSITEWFKITDFQNAAALEISLEQSLTDEIKVPIWELEWDIAQFYVRQLKGL